MSLYKYVTADRIDILQKGLIRFTQPSAFNDPFDCKPFLQSMTRGLDFSETIKISPLEIDKAFAESKRQNPDLPISPRLERKLRNGLKEFINSLSEQPMERLERLLEQEDTKSLFRDALPRGLDLSIGILSLAEESNNILMWSHYSEDHTGFVIEFDEEHSYFKPTFSEANNNGPLIMQKVRYSIGRPERPVINSLKDFEDDSSWYSAKSAEWQYENEWRMIRPLKHADVCLRLENNANKYVRLRKPRQEKPWENIQVLEEVLRPERGRYIYLFSIPPDCIKAVILGCRMSKKDSRKILRLLSRDKRYSHVKTYAASTDEKLFRLNIAPVEP
jgi:hypothetical protein